MAVIYRCDKCNDEYDEPLNKIQVPRDYDDSSYTKDLCTRCIRRLTEWLKPDAQEMKK